MIIFQWSLVIVALSQGTLNEANEAVSTNQPAAVASEIQRADEDSPNKKRRSWYYGSWWRGYRLGYSRGKKVGYSQGKKVGYSQGKKVFYSQGNKAGYSRGYRIGYGKGKTAGYRQRSRELNTGPTCRYSLTAHTYISSRRGFICLPPSLSNRWERFEGLRRYSSLSTAKRVCNGASDCNGIVRYYRKRDGWKYELRCGKHHYYQRGSKQKVWFKRC